MKIAILGGTSHIAKSLIDNYLRQGRDELYLFVRSRERMEQFLAQIGQAGKAQIKDFTELDKDRYAVLINCVGIRVSGETSNHISSIFELTETYDNLVIYYLTKHPAALYINFSSGAVFGNRFDQPVGDASVAQWSANSIDETAYYGIAKLNSEAKHRSRKDLKIVDLRVFGYFSRFIDPGSKYFLSELVNCVKNKREFVTDEQNMLRDYIHPEDLFSLVGNCIAAGKINAVYDVYSLKPAGKFEIIDHFTQKYGLKVIKKESAGISCITGQKRQYYSTSKKRPRLALALATPRWSASRRKRKRSCKKPEGSLLNEGKSDRTA